MTTNTPHPMALRLCYLGSVPFVVFAVLTWIVNPASNPDGHWYITFFLSSYAAVSVSLLGGIHWGLAFHSSSPTPMGFIWGVVPAAVSWIGAIAPPHIGLVIHSFMLMGCYWIDRQAYPNEKAVDWLTMRLRLTLVASASCLLAAIGTLSMR